VATAYYATVVAADTAADKLKTVSAIEAASARWNALLLSRVAHEFLKLAIIAFEQLVIYRNRGGCVQPKPVREEKVAREILGESARGP
jgi:hypothetical protein